MGSTTPPWRRTHSKPQRRPLKTPAPSPSSWKDTLKQTCLERARRKKQEMLWRKRLDSQASTTTNNNSNDARQLVEEELRQSGVAIVRGVIVEGAMLPSTVDSEMTVPEEEDEHAISESELYQLMQEVEEELQRDGKFVL